MEETENIDNTVKNCNTFFAKWSFLPDTVLLHIFQFLSAKELINAGLSCKSWLRVSHDQFLWRNLLYLDFKIDSSVGIAPGKSSWYSEYKRLYYHTPIVQTEVLADHAHQVLHVSFAHNGTMFATCSKDGYVFVWHTNYPSQLKYYHDMKKFSWKYTQYSQFNQSDTLLLVSGVHFGTPNSNSGEIAVFSLQDCFTLQCRVMNKPYDIFGTWFSDQYLLSGDLHWLAHLVSTSVLWLNKASQEVTSEHVPIMNKMYCFYNCNSSSIRAIMIANCLSSPIEEKENESSLTQSNSTKNCSSTTRGNPPSHFDINSSSSNIGQQHEEETPEPLIQVSSRLQASSLEGAFSNWRRQGEFPEYVCPIQYDAEYRKVEIETEANDCDTDSDTSHPDSEVSQPEFASGQDSPSQWSDQSMDAEVQECEYDDLTDQPEKYLIFTTGSKTYTPHQIGFKRIRSVNFPRKMDPGPSIRERLAVRARERELENLGIPQVEPNWLDYEKVADRFDKVDHLIDLHGHIIGMGLSPDHRFLYVNTRPWPRGYVIVSPLDPPPIAQEIDIHVIDLVTLKEVGKMLRSHRAYTPNNECFFIFLDVSNEYVASGAEDKHGYLWDRHYGICLSKFPHADVVSSVAFNPKDPEMLVTASDDYTIKIWRSRNRVKKLGLHKDVLLHGIELWNRNKCRTQKYSV